MVFSIMIWFIVRPKSTCTSYKILVVSTGARSFRYLDESAMCTMRLTCSVSSSGRP